MCTNSVGNNRRLVILADTCWLKTDVFAGMMFAGCSGSTSQDDPANAGETGHSHGGDAVAGIPAAL
jgi:hypothetical protein